MNQPINTTSYQLQGAQIEVHQFLKEEGYIVIEYFCRYIFSLLKQYFPGTHPLCVQNLINMTIWMIWIFHCAEWYMKYIITRDSHSDICAGWLCHLSHVVFSLMPYASNLTDYKHKCTYWMLNCVVSDNKALIECA